MSETRRLHREAMEVADRAFIAKRSGEEDQALHLFEHAYRQEYEAARLSEKEPSRSILHRSAATLAVHARLFREAERVAAAGLASDPPAEIANELREVIEKANFHRHLSLRGVLLSTNEMQMTIVGDAVSDGMALVEVVFERVKSFEKLVLRTAQRINNRPFGSRATGGKFYNLFISAPRTGSFAVTLRLGQPLQPMLPGFDDSTKVIDELMFSLELLNENRMDELRQVIPDNNYLTSFLGTVKSIVPDGSNVKMVGITAVRNGVEVSVGLSITAKEVKPVLDEFISEGEDQLPKEVERITGELLYANAIGHNTIKVIDDNGKRRSIIVSEAIAEDVVRPFFGTRVTVDVVKVGQRLFFQDINLSEV